MYLRYALGTQVNLGALLGDLPLQGLRGGLEFAGDWTIASMSNTSAYKTASQRFIKADILAAIRIEVSESLRLDTALQWEVATGGLYVERTLSLKLPSDYEASLGLNWFPVADAGSTFYNWRHNSRVSVSIGKALK